jgi:hypothetical protein
VAALLETIAILIAFMAVARWIFHRCEESESPLFGRINPAPTSSS